MPASSLTAADIIRRHLPSSLKGVGWTALIEALATGDEYKQTNIQAARNQLHASTATGEWLEKRGLDWGVEKPADLGISDTLYRQLIIQTTASKQTHKSIMDVLEVFYGPEATRAWCESTAAEPYNLSNGMQLILSFESGNPIYITFETTDFQTISAATALEVSEAINRRLRLLNESGWANPSFDPDSDDTFVKLYSGHRGLGGEVEVLGGSAQGRLVFGTKLPDFTAANWTIQNPSAGVIRYVPNAVSELYNLRIGDYVVVQGTEFNVNNRGYFEIVDVQLVAGAFYFEIENTLGVVEVVVPLATTSLIAFRSFSARQGSPSSTTTIRTANSIQLGVGAIEVTFPVTTRVVDRLIGEASYLHESTNIDIATLTRAVTTVTVSTAPTQHGLQAGDWVEIRDNIGGTPNASGINGFFSVATIVNPTSFTYLTPDYTGTIASVSSPGVVIKAAAPTDSGNNGPYLVDPDSGVSLTNISTTSTQQLDSLGQYHTLSVADASDFPDEPGYLAIGFGYEYQASPVQYLGRLNSTTLLLDFSFVFPQTIASGATVILLDGKAAWNPSDAPAFYITASNAGLAAASKWVDNVVAAGIDVTKTLLYPSDIGLGAEGFSVSTGKLSDNVDVFGGDEE